MYGYFSNQSADLVMQIEQMRDEAERLSTLNLHLNQRLPYLESQVASFEKILVIKEKEIKMLNDKVNMVQNRWKNARKEPSKFTAKTIFAALELKSFNEMSSYLLN